MVRRGLPRCRRRYEWPIGVLRDAGSSDRVLTQRPQRTQRPQKKRRRMSWWFRFLIPLGSLWPLWPLCFHPIPRDVSDLLMCVKRAAANPECQAPHRGSGNGPILPGLSAPLRSRLVKLGLFKVVLNGELTSALGNGYYKKEKHSRMSSRLLKSGRGHRPRSSNRFGGNNRHEPGGLPPVAVTDQPGGPDFGLPDGSRATGDRID